MVLEMKNRRISSQKYKKIARPGTPRTGYLLFWSEIILGIDILADGGGAQPQHLVPHGLLPSPPHQSLVGHVLSVLLHGLELLA